MQPKSVNFQRKFAPAKFLLIHSHKQKVSFVFTRDLIRLYSLHCLTSITCMRVTVCEWISWRTAEANLRWKFAGFSCIHKFGIYSTVASWFRLTPTFESFKLLRCPTRSSHEFRKRTLPAQERVCTRLGLFPTQNFKKNVRPKKCSMKFVPDSGFFPICHFHRAPLKSFVVAF